jgi:S1-C subfamily serine protease
MNESLRGPLVNSQAGTPQAPRGSRPSLRLGAIAGIALLSAAVGAGTGAGVASLIDNGGNSTSTAVTSSAPGSSSSTIISQTGAVSIADLYTRLRPSVVQLEVSSSSGAGTGSGVILDAEGHIVTNYHVVQDMSEIDVKLSDGTIVTASVVGTDPGDDLAVIKIDPSGLNLTPATLADTSQLRIGDSVIAIGNPLDLEATLTEGVVSGLGRVLSDGNGRPLRELVQTDTAINPGNSGGGLFNLNGQLVGITNALENPTGQDSFSGIGYAIPASTLQQYLSDMLAGKTVSHPRLGVSLGNLTPQIAQQMGLKVDSGVMIGSVQRGSGAARAGLQGAVGNQPGDVIVAIDGHAVKTFDDLAGYLDTKNPGDKVTLQVVRDGQQMDVSVTLDAWTQ